MLNSLFRHIFLRLVGTKPGSYLFFKASASLFGMPSPTLLPDEFIRFSKLWAQGMVNADTFPFHPQYLWPQWVSSQLDPSSDAFSYQGYPLPFLNVTARNWTVLSAPDADDKPVVDTHGVVTPCINGWSLDVWVRSENNLVAASGQKAESQVLDPNHRGVVTTSLLGPLRIRQEAFFRAYGSQEHLVFQKISATNTTDKVQSVSVMFAVRPMNPLGVSPVSHIHYVSKQAFIVNNRLGVIFDQKPDNVVCLPFSESHPRHMASWNLILGAQCPLHLATGFVEYRLTLQPGQTWETTLKLPTSLTHQLKKVYQRLLSPFQKEQLLESVDYFLQKSISVESENTAQNWTKTLENATTLRVSADPKLETVFAQNVVHLVQGIGHQPYSGMLPVKTASLRDAFWTLMACNRLGFPEHSHQLFHRYALKAVPYVRPWSIRYEPLLHAYDELGMLLVLMKDYVDFSHDATFVQTHLPHITQVIRRLKKLRVKGKASNLAKGLLKASASFTQNGVKDHYIWDNLWAIAGLKSALSLIPQVEKQAAIQRVLADWRGVFEKVVDKKSAIEGLPIQLPVGLSTAREQDQVFSLAALYPLELYDADEPVITNTLTAVEHSLREGRVFHPGDAVGFSPFANAFLGHQYLSSGNPGVFGVLSWLVANASSTGTWPGVIHPKTQGGCWGEGQDTKTTATFLLLVSRLLVQEQADGVLALLPFCSETWLKNNGDEVGLTHAHTSFGKCSFLARREGNTVSISLSHAFYLKPKYIKITLPFALESVSVDGGPVTPLVPTYVMVSPDSKQVVIHLKENQDESAD
ncbi:MAG: hypothetical protein AB7F28_06605 [Candidatus Margulisiibacteriota bacterium]